MSKPGAQNPRPAGALVAGSIRPVIAAARAVWVFASTTVRVCLLGKDANL